MKMPRKMDIWDIGSAFCNQKVLNEQLPTENKLWTSILFYYVCFFRVDLEASLHLTSFLREDLQSAVLELPF